ncbi:M20/M25/M40 family metallo-hydrolase [Melittangium boletus]|uniref:Vacuolar membrane protease n=1 Tax=Melittangium boletus DSM 14713 TaxID=1294270 RepID=A0A250ISU6_9BACT|nr:M20/M25/M40 family metallo-hydrolase [Melittangium boletus]ATB34310.1 peptidase M28 [Melittangium boletus DSM 14713]
MTRGGLFAGLAVAVLFVGAWVAYRPVLAPLREEPGSAAGGAADFHWRQVAERLRIISSGSHFIGTQAHREVYQYLLAEAAKNPGVQVELQTVEDSYRAWDPFAIATVNNVVARLPGTQGERSVLVVAHYDSAPTSPGAADDGTAVAAMLEVLRLMASGPRPRNDLLFLFADAEEVGSMGADAFLAARTPAERARIAAVLNFDARGNRGPVVMFETSRDNGWLIERFATASPSPVGHSLASTIYGLLKNDTDFSVFRDAGLNGLNFAYFDGLEVYHSREESAAAVDPRSIQHQGDQMLALVRQLANEDLSRVASPPVIYFDVLGLFVVRYGRWLSQLLLLPCGVGWGLLVFRGVRSGRLRLGRCGVAIAVSLGAVLLSALLAWGAWGAVRWIEPRYTLLPGETSPSTEGYFIGLLVLSSAVLLGCAHAARRILTPAELAVGALTPWTVLAVLSVFLLPDTSYFFQWPQLCGLGLLGFMLRARGQPPELSPIALGLAPLLFVPSIVLVVPLTRLLYAAFGMTGIALVIALWSLWLILLVPYLHAVLGGALVWGARLGFVAGGLIFLAAFVLRVFDPTQPSMNSLVYLLDTDQKKAFWVSADPFLDEWTGPILGADVRRESLEHYFPYVDWKVFVAETAVRDHPAPELEVLSDTREGSRRKLTLRLRPRLEASMLELRVSPAKLLGVEVAGKFHGPDELRSEWGRLIFQFWTPATTGNDMTLILEQGLPLELRLSEVRYGSEATEPLLPRPRPADKSPYPFGWFSDSVRVTHTVRL